MASERIKAALAHSKNRNTLGLRSPKMQSKRFRRRLQACAAAALRKAALERAEAHRIHIEWALKQPGIDGKTITFHRAGERLNDLDIPSPMGGRWSSTNVADVAVRLGLRKKPPRVPREVIQARVHAFWKVYPECTGLQVVEMLKPHHPICIARAWNFLRVCRETAARGNPAQREMGWRLDHRTRARMQIVAICRRHPELTAKQVIGRLKPKRGLPVQWVQKMLREYWRTSVGCKAKRRHVGRRIYNRRRGCHRESTAATRDSRPRKLLTAPI